MRQASTYSVQSGLKSVSDVRNCFNVPFYYKEVFDISETLKDFTMDWYPEALPTLWYSQFEFIRYLPPAQTFQRHQDDNETSTNHNRLYTSVTMMEKSDDLDGGLLRVWLPNSEISIDIDLDPYETVVFPSYFWHEATPVFKGRRVVMISWGSKNRPEENNA